jgi:hypothetical protein
MSEKRSFDSILYLFAAENSVAVPTNNSHCVIPVVRRQTPKHQIGFLKTENLWHDRDYRVNPPTMSRIWSGGGGEGVGGVIVVETEKKLVVESGRCKTATGAIQQRVIVIGGAERVQVVADCRLVSTVATSFWGGRLGQS